MRNSTFRDTKPIAFFLLTLASQTFAATDAEVISRLQSIVTEGPAPMDEAAAIAAIPINSISLERTPCYGPCPIYTITFNKAGTAELEGKDYVPHKGKWHAKIAVRDFVRLSQLVFTAKFFNLENEYSGGWTDNAITIVTVNMGKVNKRVSDYGNVGPAQLWGIAQAIDSISSGLKWKLVQSSPPAKNLNEPH